MATTKTTTTARKTSARKTSTAKTSAKKVTTARKAPTTTSTAPSTAGRHEFDVRALVTNSAYATIGAGDLAVETARTLPKRLEAQRKARAERAQAFVKEAPIRAQALVKDAPTKLQAEWTHGYEAARKELDVYAARGRKLIDSIANAPQTKRALDQTETARSQVKGAVTSIRKAVEQGQEAAEGAVRRIGVRRSA
ncbi:hypothetical protein [Euzebya sp.]|uniref:hypothetical protein n=1 Tax=Euzebya sp. TaxID=1971409 RepID=UPI0035190AC6